MFKKLYCLALLITFISCTEDESSVTPEIKKGKIETFVNVNGTTRDYIIHIPQSYTGNEKHPLLFAFHGLGGNMQSSYNNSKFHLLAESENFIVVHPNGISSRWNAVTANNNVDIDFVNALINKLQNEYNIDATRIYSTGMSNGGYFSFLLACELSNKIAAIGSVTGLMFQDVLANCEPERAVPVIQIHGTDDSVVNYDNVANIITYWVDHNNTNTTPVVSDILDTDTTDGSTVQRFVYADGDNGTEVHHLKITGGQHDWPGHEGNMDINASEEVWNFLKQFNINGKI